MCLPFNENFVIAIAIVTIVRVRMHASDMLIMQPTALSGIEIFERQINIGIGCIYEALAMITVKIFSVKTTEQAEIPTWNEPVKNDAFIGTTGAK